MKRWLFWLWFRIAPDAAAQWLNGKLEDAARADRYADEQRDNSDPRSFRSVIWPVVRR